MCDSEVQEDITRKRDSPHRKNEFVEDSRMYFFLAVVSVIQATDLKGESRDDQIRPRRSERQEVASKGFLRKWLGGWTTLVLR
jgi:hypothetical protein